MQVELILFAIRSAIRINEQVRRGFADLVRTAQITLPLPNFPSQPDMATARSFYERDGKNYLASDTRVTALHMKWPQVTDDEKGEYLSLYREHWALRQIAGVTPGARLDADLTWDDCNAILTVRQWRRGAEQAPSLLQRAAGTLVEIAVDYHTQVPGVVNTNTAQGKVVKTFLESIQRIEFAEGAPHAVGAQLVESFFVSTLESLRDHPQLVSDSARSQQLIGAVTSGLLERAQELVAEEPEQLNRERIEAWARALFPSLIHTSATLVLDDPRRFLGVRREDQAALVSGIGRALLSTLGDPEKPEFSRVFSQQSLDAVVRASLEVVARYPALVGPRQETIARLVMETTTALARKADTFGPDLLPELLRLVMEKSATHLEQLLPGETLADPRKHLLITALDSILTVLSQAPPPDARWKPTFSAPDALQLAEALVAEVVQNPDWMMPSTQSNPLLATVLAAVLHELRTHGGGRLRRESAKGVLIACVRAVGQRAELGVQNPDGQVAIAVVVAAVMKAIHSADTPTRARWVLARDEVSGRLLDLILARVVERGWRSDTVRQVQDFLDQTIELIERGDPWTWETLTASLCELLKA